MTGGSADSEAPSQGAPDPDATGGGLRRADIVQLSHVLGDVATQALGWATTNSSRFELAEDVTEPGVDLGRTLEPLGELVRLCAAVGLHTHFGEPVRRRADRLLKFAWQETSSGHVLLDAFRAGPHTTRPLEIYSAFALAGLRNPEFEQFARCRVETRSWRCLEQDPHRRLGVLVAERRAGLRPHEDTEHALWRTWLGGLPEPWAFDPVAGYAVADTVFQLSEWGSAPLLVPAEIDEYLHQWLPCWLDLSFEEQRWDLACRLLAVGACLPHLYPPEGQRGAWRQLLTVRAADGALRTAGPGGGAEAGSPDADEDVLFVQNYPATLALAFAAVVSRLRLRGLLHAGAR